jgi:hypothetical protein
MRKTLRILAVCAILFSFIFSLTGCDQFLSGTYEATFGDATRTESKVTFEFVLYWVRITSVDYNGENTETTEHIGTYQISDGTISFRFDDMDGKDLSFSFSRESVDGRPAIRIGGDLFLSAEFKLE